MDYSYHCLTCYSTCNIVASFMGSGLWTIRFQADVRILSFSPPYQQFSVADSHANTLGCYQKEADNNYAAKCGFSHTPKIKQLYVS